MNSTDIQQMQTKFIEIQNSLKNEIKCEDCFDKTKIKTVAGVDLAYWNDSQGEENAVCCIVIIDINTHNIIEKQQYTGKIEVPYMPGFFAFRELPLVLKTVELLETHPDIFMFDGNGYLHPQHMGIATHASFYLNAPTIGVAKTYFRIKKDLDFIEPELSKGSFTDIMIEGDTYGRVLRTHQDIKPVFISIGNYISLDTATKLVLDLVNSESHIPIPTRLADLETHNARKRIIESLHND